MKTLITLALLAFTASASAQAFAPFGIPLTATVDDLKAMGAEDAGDGLWTLDTAPQGGPEYYNYGVIVSPAGRICSVEGDWKLMTTGADGKAFKQEFIRLRDTLNTRYGPSYNEDGLKPGSTLTRSADWMRALKAGQRVLTSWWESDSRSELPPGIEQVILTTDVLSTTRGWISLIYRATDFQACMHGTTTGL